MNSLKKPLEFKTVYKSGKKAFSKNFFIAWKASNEKKIGLTVSSKVGKAVTRNRIKRRLREIFRSREGNIPLAIIVITAREGAGDLTNSEIRKEAALLLEKVHV